MSDRLWNFSQNEFASLTLTQLWHTHKVCCSDTAWKMKLVINTAVNPLKLTQADVYILSSKTFQTITEIPKYDKSTCSRSDMTITMTNRQNSDKMKVKLNPLLQTDRLRVLYMEHNCVVPWLLHEWLTPSYKDSAVCKGKTSSLS